MCSPRGLVWRSLSNGPEEPMEFHPETREFIRIAVPVGLWVHPL